MKIVIGVDDVETGIQLGEFAARLEFPAAEFEFVHVFYPMLVPPGEIFTDALLLADLDAAAKAAKAEMSVKLGKIAAQFQSRNIPARFQLLTGSPGGELVRYAQETKADLLVVGRSPRSRLDRLFLGSISRGVVVSSKTSVLVVKPTEQEHRGAVRALLAVDHSDYCKACVEQFHKFSPRGISGLIVLNVVPEEYLTRLRWALPERVGDFAEFTLEKFKKRTNELAKEFSGRVLVSEARTEIGNVTNAIQENMESTNSELLIVGAQGHSFLERMSLGSTSFHQAMSEPYSVLIIRT